MVLLSGGLDSATTLAIARSHGFRCVALSFAYGQRNAFEISAAASVARALGACEHHILHLDLRAFGGSALTSDLPVPKDRDLNANEIPITYVPARNTIFLAHALALAEVRQAEDIYIGVNALDYSGYPDCRPEYIAAFEQMAQCATRAGVQGGGVRIRTPLIALRKEQIIRAGLELGVDYGLTRSCYDPDQAGRGCGHCDSCRLRLTAFSALGMRDPAPYVENG